MENLRKLTRKESSDFITKEVCDYDPYKEYFVFNEETKKCFILRKVEDKIAVIDLKFASPMVNDYNFVTEEQFKELVEYETVVEIPHYDDCSTQSRKKENSSRKAMFQYLLDKGYFD